MMCPHCEARVQKLLLGLEHVVSAEVSHVSGTAVLTLSANVSDEEIKTLIEADGYTVTSIC